MDDDLLGPPTKKRVGRPPSNNNALRGVLLKACPPDPDTGQRSVLILAGLMGLTTEALFKWIRLNKIPPLQAAKVVDVSKGRVTLHDFTPFIFLEDLDG